MPPTAFILDGHFTQMNGSGTVGGPFPLASQYSSAVLYSALSMSEGPHELIITNLDGDDKTPLVLDELLYTPLNIKAQPLRTSASSIASSASNVSSMYSPISSSATGSRMRHTH